MLNVIYLTFNATIINILLYLTYIIFWYLWLYTQRGWTN